MPIDASHGKNNDSAITHSVIDFLSMRDQARPFFLQIGYVNPHDICQFGHKFEDAPVPDPVAQGILTEADLPPLPANHEFNEPETMIQRIARRDDNCLYHWPILRRVRQWTELQWRYLAWALYRLVERVDAEIGTVLAALEATGHAENTLILFTSDHGEAAGQHRMFQKFTLYEESARVPFVASCLGQGVAVRKNCFDTDHLISGVDIFPTVCDYAGVPAPDNLPGLSMRPLFEGQASSWRDFLLIESNFWGRAIVGDRYKYITEYRPKEVEDFVAQGPESGELGIEQMFDLQTDPGETVNIALLPERRSDLEQCRRHLAECESRLSRRALQGKKVSSGLSPRENVSRMSKRLREGWQRMDRDRRRVARETSVVLPVIEPSPLHWSFDYHSERNLPEYRPRLIETLRDYDNQSDEAGRLAEGARVESYLVLPNYSWPDRVARRELGLDNGVLELENSPTTGGGRHYVVRLTDRVSAERSVFTFETESNGVRDLTGAFKVTVENTAEYQYKDFECEGRVAPGDRSGERSINQITDGFAITPRDVGALPLVTLWSMLHVVPYLDGSGSEPIEVAVFEELQQLRWPARLYSLGPWQWPSPNEDLGELRGWCLHGVGLMPVYYWVSNDKTVIASAHYWTWVARGPSPSPRNFESHSI